MSLVVGEKMSGILQEIAKDVVIGVIKKYVKGVDLEVSPLTIESERFGSFKIEGKIRITLLKENKKDE